MRVLVVDNYDSFTHNLVHLVAGLGAEVRVVRNDACPASAMLEGGVDAAILSPGPGSPDVPADIGVAFELLALFRGRVPVLGVCLGHQTIAAAFGARIVRAPVPVHGKTCEVEHDGSQLFASVPRKFTAMRYHSLVVEAETLPPHLVVTAVGPGGIIMALRHVDQPLYGVQFHPESVGTPDGAGIVRNFLGCARVAPRSGPIGD